MLKLLIADDDPFTLQGIYGAMPWDELGIETVLLASNGSKAFDIACREKPQLLLTDVRMPKMDGIELAAAYREREADCQIIFMSGFSDKEYLKSAIKLRAVSYVEKPIDLDELGSVLRLAVKQCLESGRLTRTDTNKIAAAVPLIASELALAITKSKPAQERIAELSDLAGFTFPARMRLQTLLIKIRSQAAIKPEQPEALADFFYNLAAGLLTEPNTTGFAAIKDNMHLVVHLYNAAGNAEKLQDDADRFAANLLDALPDREMAFVAIGKSVVGLANAEASYNSAAITLQHMFFNGLSVCGYHSNSMPAYAFNPDVAALFGGLIANRQFEQATRMIHSLTFDVKQHKNTTVNSVKEMYFQLLFKLVQSAGEEDIRLFDTADSPDFLWNLLNAFDTIGEIRDFFVRKIEHYVAKITAQSPYSGVVDSILGYIHAHYANEELSITHIGAHTMLTTSYLCNRFKHETGQTINQYLTEYRIGKAKELLRDPALKIADVSSRVGYSNGDYFAKCFRKLTGKKPSDYKEACDG